MAKKIIFIEIGILAIVTMLFGVTSGGNLFVGDINSIDEGQFAAWANHMMHGKKMFKDIYITYGPLYVYPVYLLFKVFGPSAFIVRLFLLLGTLLSIITVLLVMHRLHIKFYVRWVIMTLFIVLPLLQFRHFFGWIAIFLLLLIIERPKKTYYYGLLGASIFFGFLVSPDVALAIGMVTLCAFLLLFLEKKFEFKNLLTFLFSISVVFVVFFIWSNSEGWFWSYLSTTIDNAVSLSGDETPLGKGFPNFMEITKGAAGVGGVMHVLFKKEMLLYWGLAFYLIWVFYGINKTVKGKMTSGDRGIIIIGLFGIILYNILIGRSGIGHYFFVLSPLLIVFAYFMQELVAKVYTKNQKTKVVAVCLLVICYLFTIRLFYINHPQVIINIRNLEKVKINVGENKFLKHILVSEKQEEYIENLRMFTHDHIGKESYVFFLTDEPLMYAAIDRVNPTRYDLPFIASSKPKRYEILQDLKQNPPEFIFENTRAWHVDEISNRERLPEVISFIVKNYELYKSINGVRIFKLKSNSI